jgi:Na+/H+ antiporter NhaD/arsenite permease-like protein
MGSQASKCRRAPGCSLVMASVLLFHVSALFGQQTLPAVTAAQPIVTAAPTDSPAGSSAPVAAPGHSTPAATAPGVEHKTDAADQPAGGHGAETESAGRAAPSLLAVIPFVALLLCIALLPLIHSVEHWWHHNRNKFIVAAALAVVTLLYYLLRGTGFGHGEHAVPAGFPTVVKVLEHAVLGDYIPFIILLFSLYTISGGIQLRGDLRARPGVNTVFLGLGAVLASIIGTTGASMLLIRPLLQTNSERKHVRHTVIFFIFLVSNIGGSLLPTGDPPLFLGYLRGVPFLWTLSLWKEWAFACCVLLVIYWIWDTIAYREETEEDRWKDKVHVEPLRIAGSLNFLWLALVIAAVGVMVPGEALPGTSFTVPAYLREGAMLIVVAIAWMTSASAVRKSNSFDFAAITEVAVLFIGIFITMQAPIEILKAEGPRLGLTQPWQFFWAAGGLSSFLDNAPTYVVYFETAGSLPVSITQGMQLLGGVETAAGSIPFALLTAVSLGAVFMGANTYIGNGPNFMVKSIAEQSGIKMPSFFGYMCYSIGILIPLFLLITVIFLM